MFCISLVTEIMVLNQNGTGAAISDYHDQILKEGSCGSICGSGSVTIVIKKDI